MINISYSKNIERINYLILLISLQIAYLYIYILIVISFILPRKKNKKDLILYPFAQKGSTGYFQRFEIYFPFLKRDNISFDIQNVFDDDYIIKEINKGKVYEFRLYIKIIWKRIFQVLKSRNYKSAFYQRHLFPFYPDRKNALLEKLLYKLNSNVIVDYWDSDWVRSPELISQITNNYVHKISCVNKFIFDHFESSNKERVLLPIGVKSNQYKHKLNYDINFHNIKLFYTGQIGNVKIFLNMLKEPLIKLSNKYNITIEIVSREKYYIKGLNINYHKFSKNTFFSIMSECDIGLYAMKDGELGRGKMAMKTLDYMASGLPSVVSPVGLSPFAIDNENCLFAEMASDFYDKILLLLNNNILRAKIGKNAVLVIKKNHELINNYNCFKEIVLFNK